MSGDRSRELAMLVVSADRGRVREYELRAVSDSTRGYDLLIINSVMNAPNANVIRFPDPGSRISTSIRL